MNCTPGCLAFFVGPRAPACPLEAAICAAARDRIVRCVSQCDGLWTFEAPIRVRLLFGGWLLGGAIDAAPEEYLRPINPDGDQDEVLSIAKLPAGREAVAA